MIEPAQPTLVERPEQPYVAIRGRVTMDSIPSIADRFPELLGWLGEQQIALAGSPFLKYNLLDSDGILEIEASAPVAELPDTAASDLVVSGSISAGRFASLVHVGPYDGLLGATERLLSWIAEQGLTCDTSDTPAGERWGGRLEIYHTDPRQTLDPADWTTELAFRLAD